MRKPKIQILHVNQAVLRKNTVCNEDNPPLIIRGKSRSQKVVYAHEADLLLDGNVVGTLVYDPQHPLDCGARIWLQTDKLQIKPRLRGKTGEKAHG